MLFRDKREDLNTKIEYLVGRKDFAGSKRRWERIKD